MGDFFRQLGDVLGGILGNLLDPEKWQPVLRDPAVFWAVVAALAVIVFAETGLLVGFFLPGDSLLASVGIVAYAANWEAWQIGTLLAVLCVAAVVGDSVGYAFGRKAGRTLYDRPDSRFFKRKHLDAARAFYDRHGGKTIIYARFVPIVRTFAPIVAGAAGMNYKRFLVYNVVGGIAWICSMFAFGYTLHVWLEPLIKQFFPNFKVVRNIDVIALVIIFISIAPMLVKGVAQWRAGRKAAAVVTTAPPAA